MKKTHRILPLAFVFAVCLLVSARAAKADTAIYNNFGPGMSFNTNTSSDYFRLYGSNGESAAMAFTVGGSGNYDLTNIIIALGYVDGGSITVTLSATPPGSLGSPLESWIVTPLYPDNEYNEPYTPETLPSGGVVLDAGQEYWVTAAANGGFSDGAWNLNSNGDTGTVATMSAYASGVWNAPYNGTNGAFEVLGDPVGAPEPGTMTLLGLGLGALGIFRRRKTD